MATAEPDAADVHVSPAQSAAFEGLAHLLRAPSRAVAEQIFVTVFRAAYAPRDAAAADGADARESEKTVSRAEIAQSLVAALGLTRAEADALEAGVRWIVRVAVYENVARLQPLFPAGFHEGLCDLVCAIIEAHLAEWRAAARRAQVGLPRLRDFDWRIDVKRASDTAASMAVPSVLVRLDIARGATSDAVVFELTKQSLESMVDGLSKIRAQLLSLK